MSTETTARQPKGVPVGGQFAQTAKAEPTLALSAAPTAFGLGANLKTATYGFHGVVTDVHAGCPMGAAQVMGHEVPIRKEALEPGYPWYSMKLHSGGAVFVPHYDVIESVSAPTETERLRTAAHEAFSKLMVADPRAAHTLWESMQADVSAGEYPELGVGQDEDGNAVFLDPDTGRPTALVVEDVAFRWNRTDQLDVDDKVAVVSYDGHGDYETLIYRSGATQEPVRLPEGWTEEST